MTHGENGPAHGPAPLPGVDATDLHRAVEALTAALHEYVDTAVGARAQFGATEADDEPRILLLERRIATLNAALYDVIHERLGIHPDLTTMTWDDREPDRTADDAGPEDVEAFHLGFLVTRGGRMQDTSMSAVVDLIDEAGAQIARDLVERGFQVPEWGTSRGEPVDFDEDEDDDL